ncbi:MAG: DUF2232 domain-containing protein [Desulfuromonadaceae bacterium]|nr:DUF2232 domain-containing protein [Desulfuromonadaceae bacterium]MDD2855214.1 DUF2232 domain-containing protein [Desulfuromonadaceae bacterium]
MSFESPTGYNIQTRLKASLLGVVGSFILFATYLTIPPLGLFSGILAPFPVAYNRLLHGRASSLIIVLGTTALITLLFGLLAGFMYMGMCVLTGLLLPELLVRRISASRSLFWTTVANFLLLYSSVAAYAFTTGLSIKKMISNEISSSFNQAVTLYEKGGITGEDLELLKSSMTTAAELLHRLYPSLIVSMLIVIAGCNLLLLKKSIAKTAPDIIIGEFSTFKCHDLTVWVLIATGITQLLPESQITYPALNVLLVVLFVYFIQGMAVVSTLLSRHSISTFLRIMLYVLLIIQPYLLALIAGIGLFDLWVDFRTPKTQENL